MRVASAASSSAVVCAGWPDGDADRSGRGSAHKLTSVRHRAGEVKGSTVGDGQMSGLSRYEKTSHPALTARVFGQFASTLVSIVLGCLSIIHFLSLVELCTATALPSSDPCGCMHL